MKRKGSILKISIRHKFLLSPRVVENKVMNNFFVQNAPKDTSRSLDLLLKFLTRNSANSRGIFQIKSYKAHELFCRQGETLGSGFARLFARLFAVWGVALLDPSDPEFHHLAKPLFRAAIENAPELIARF